METLENNNDEHEIVNEISDWELKLNEVISKNNYGFYKSRSEIHYGPPPDWNNSIPNHSMEVFIGALPRDFNIYELICLIEETLGKNSIYELSVMLDTSHSYMSSKVIRNRGFAFVTFQNKDLALECRDLLDNKEVRPGKRIRMNQSTPNLHLFVANVPSNKNRDELLRDLREFTDGLMDVMIFAAKTGNGEMDSKRHRGFVFLEYETHSAAANARRKLSKPGFRLWNRELKVDWAAKKQEPSQEVMSKVKSIYVRNLTAECTDQNLRDYFSNYGEIESIKKVRDFAFIHFKDRASAISALSVSNKTVLPNDISNGTIDVELVKPNINSQYKSVGFSFSNLLTPPFLSYPYGLPIPPPPTHLLPPHHLMYGLTNSSHMSLSNKNRPSTAWHIMNGIKNNGLTNPRQNKIGIPTNRPSSNFDSGISKWVNNIDHPSYTNPSIRSNVSVGASGDNSGNPQLNSNSDNKSPSNSYSGKMFYKSLFDFNKAHVKSIYDVNKRIKAIKQANCSNPQALFYWGVSPNDIMYRDSPFIGW